MLNSKLYPIHFTKGRFLKFCGNLKCWQETIIRITLSAQTCFDRDIYKLFDQTPVTSVLFEVLLNLNNMLDSGIFLWLALVKYLQILCLCLFVCLCVSISMQAWKGRWTPQRKDLIPGLSILELQIRPPTLLKAANSTHKHNLVQTPLTKGKFYYQSLPYTATPHHHHLQFVLHESNSNALHHVCLLHTRCAYARKRGFMPAFFIYLCQCPFTIYAHMDVLVHMWFGLFVQMKKLICTLFRQSVATEKTKPVWIKCISLPSLTPLPFGKPLKCKKWKFEIFTWPFHRHF